MPRDERIFRVTRQGYRKPSIKYASRTQVSAMFARYMGDGSRPDILKVEAVDPADIEWADVTDEFRNKPEPKGCRYHPAYTGVRKPYIWSGGEWFQSYYRDCKCTGIYLTRHPEYPAHDPLCGHRNLDPATCSCQILRKLTE